MPAGLTIDTELRWRCSQALVANGAAGAAEIEAELASDRTASGEREAAYAPALIPTAEAQGRGVGRADRRASALPNWLQRALLQGFQHPAQVELTAPYREQYFDVVDKIWASRDSEPAQEFVQLAYPAYQVGEETVAADRRVAGRAGPAGAAAPPGRPRARDGVVRALRARGPGHPQRLSDDNGPGTT